MKMIKRRIRRLTLKALRPNRRRNPVGVAYAFVVFPLLKFETEPLPNGLKLRRWSSVLLTRGGSSRHLKSLRDVNEDPVFISIETEVRVQSLTLFLRRDADDRRVAVTGRILFEKVRERIVIIVVVFVGVGVRLLARRARLRRSNTWRRILLSLTRTRGRRSRR